MKSWISCRAGGRRCGTAAASWRVQAYRQVKSHMISQNCEFLCDITINLLQWLQGSLYSLWTQYKMQPDQSGNQDCTGPGQSVAPVQPLYRFRSIVAPVLPNRWYHIWHHIIQWYHNYVISHNGDIRQNYMTSYMMSCVIWFYPFFGSCDIVKMTWCHMVYHGKISISHDPKNG